MCRTNTPPAEPPFGFKLQGRLVPASQGRKRIPLLTDTAAQSARDSRPRIQDPIRFLLALPVVSLDAHRALFFITSVTNDSISGGSRLSLCDNPVG